MSSGGGYARLTILNKLSPKGKECDPGGGYSVQWVGRSAAFTCQKDSFQKGLGVHLRTDGVTGGGRGAWITSVNCPEAPRIHLLQK